MGKFTLNFFVVLASGVLPKDTIVRRSQSDLPTLHLILNGYLHLATLETILLTPLPTPPSQHPHPLSILLNACMHGRICKLTAD